MSHQQTAIGVDVGGTNMRAARISSDGEILQKISISGNRDPHVALELIGDLIRRLDEENVGGIGIGIPGRVDGWTGEVLSGGFLDLSGVSVKQALSSRFGRPVAVSNDCSMALIGEARRGAAQGLRSAVMLTIGTGIGGAIMEHGHIVNGKRCAGQLGHLVVNVGGQRCRCGQSGCIETEFSGTSLRRHLDEAGYGPEARFEDLLKLAVSGDPKAIGVMQAWAGPLRAAINTLSAAFDPDVVVLGGGMGQAAMRALSFLPENRSWYQVDVRSAVLGDDAGVIGAGLAAINLPAVVDRSLNKRLVMVNGVPASGKSAVANEIVTRTGWPVLALDTIKNPFLELIEDVDRPFNRILGRASFKSIFSAIKNSAPGSTFVVDAWFGFQPIEVLREHIALAGITEVVELWCHAPPQIIGERYGSRLGNRLPGHPGPEYIPELVELAKKAGPCGLSPVLALDTTQAIDLDAVVTWVREKLGQSV